MDTLLDLRDAFKKIILDYKNIKCLEPGSSSEVTSITECIDKVKVIEPSKITHLTLFQKIIESIDELLALLVKEKPVDAEMLANAKQFRQLYKDSLINILKELYKLNHHMAYSCQAAFGGTFYELTTTRSLYYLGCALTELGQCIRENLLIPLNASGVVNESEAFINIESKLNTIFDNIERKEQFELDKYLESQIHDLKRKLEETNKKTKTQSTLRVGFWENGQNKKDKSIRIIEQSLIGMKNNG